MYRAVQQLRPRLLAAVCPRPAMAFEAATLYLCATAYSRANRHARWSVNATAPGSHPASGYRGASAHPTTPGHRVRPGHPTARPHAGVSGHKATVAVADFSTSSAADRFRAAVADQVPYPLSTQELRSGIRHRYEVYQVRVPLEHASHLLSLLADAWRRGVDLFTSTQPTSASSPRWRHRRDLAVAAWRGALLAGPAVRTSRGLGIRTPVDLAPVIVRAARVLDVKAEMQYHRSAPIVCVADEREARMLLARVSPVEVLPTAEPGKSGPVYAASLRSA